MQHLFGRYAFGVAQSANADYHLFGGLEVLDDVFVKRLCFGHRSYHDALGVGTFAEDMPNFFGDERHEGVEHTHQFLEQGYHGVVGGFVDGLLVSGFYHLKQPRAEIVPHQFVGGHQGVAQAVFAEIVLYRGEGFVQMTFEPQQACVVLLRLRQVFVHAPAFHQTHGVPYLVAEVTSLFAESLVERQVVACGGGEQHAHAHAVGAEFVDKLDWVGRVAERFRHLASQFVSHNSGEIDVAERHLVCVFLAGHYHTCHPEEDDVGCGDEVGGGVVVTDFVVVGLQNAVEKRQRPQPRAEPCVETVAVLTQVGGGEVGVAGLFLGQTQCVVGVLGHHETAFGQVPRRNLVSPPQLAAYAPVLDVLQPVAVQVFVLGGMEGYLAVFHGLKGYLGKVFHLEEPLHGEFRLDRHVGAFGVAHFIVVVLHFLEQSGSVEVFHNLFAHRLACHADIHAGVFAEGGVVVEYVDALQVVFLAEHIVVHVVGWGYLKASRAEFDVHVAVLDNGDGAVHQRHYHFLAPQPLVFGVGGVDTHCCVAHDGLGTCRCHDGVATALVVGGDNLAFVACGAGSVVVCEVVAQVEQFAVFVFKDNLLVA